MDNTNKIIMIIESFVAYETWKSLSAHEKHHGKACRRRRKVNSRLEQTVQARARSSEQFFSKTGSGRPLYGYCMVTYMAAARG